MLVFVFLLEDVSGIGETDGLRCFWYGVGRYAILSALLALYIVLVEKDIVFEGKRRTIAGRVRIVQSFQSGRRD